MKDHNKEVAMIEIKVGDRVRVIDKRALPKVGFEFTVRAIVPDESAPELGGAYAKGVGAVGGVWVKFLEVIASPSTLPTTQNIKRTFKRYAFDGMVTEDEALQMFNKWYTQELEEAREEGRAEARAETAKVEKHFLVFTGPYERYADSEQAVTRVERELPGQGIFASVTAVDASTDVFTVNPSYVSVGSPRILA